MAKKVTPKNLSEVLMRLWLVAQEDEDNANTVCAGLNKYLDEMLGNDFFGTEGQLDPRGDRRNDD